MWQILLGAAVAGSTGLLAKHLFNPNPNPNNPISQGNPNSDNDQEKQDLQFQNGFLESGCESNGEDKGKQDGIFRFSSSESAGKTGVKTKDRNLRKKVVLKKAEKRSSGAGGVEVSRRKLAVCLKKRRTAKNVAYKCGSCPSKGEEKEGCWWDSSVFRWGLGFGIMYMMSAGKAEINKLNSTMDETAKVVQDLKTELCKRKSSCNVRASNSANEVTTGSKKFSGKNTQLLLDKSGTVNRDDNEIKVCSLPVIDDGEYASSVLTEEPEPEPEVGEMDQLEAELESELQKLSETEVSTKSLHESVGQRSDSYQCQGVLPSELDQKLCHLLIEQQENQIEELESELSSAQSKLRDKEAELQALKDCVRRLTNFSLSTVSDDDTEAQGEQARMNDQDCPIKSGLETRKSLVGMKRPIES
ncbi:Retinitis pigmentosa 1-like 1 protein, putative [Theobroma cacao]|uniref:Retinitis pigmentosa 1-like 1 protein, putative n=1 Tax=Theobroma cacao TaxID=3641 RepID=A0A061ERY2_THECC|nr:Retinitis pigmentosa 1-like 1 protein, putative [Theobroma cacao]